MPTTESAPTEPTENLRVPSLDGELRFDPVTRSAAADDFGHLVHQVPEAVLLPGSAGDVAATVTWAARRRRKVAPQGQRHSVWGRSQANRGIVIDMSSMRSVGEPRGDTVVVEAGATWSQVLAATLPRGKTPPVLTDYLELSVGGTISVGGVGGTTSRYGLQSDNVVSMDVVTGSGQRLTCSARTNADLFDAVRAGLGQAGVIIRATLKLVDAPQRVRRLLLRYPDLPTMLEDQRILSADDRFDVVQGAILAAPTGGTLFRLDLAKYFTGTAPVDAALLAGLSDDPTLRQPSTLTYLAYLNRLAELERMLRANGQWCHPHPWLTTFVGDSAVEQVVSNELDRLEPPTDLGGLGQVVLSPIRRDPITSPLARLPSDSLCYAFNLIRIPTTGDHAAARELAESNKATYERVRRAGGTLYPVSALPMSKEDWRRHFGPVFDRFSDAKDTHDPANTLTPGYDVFERYAHENDSRAP
jgi:FAD/FMN-containing dehydrogenase